MKPMELFCMQTKLSVNSSKLKIMLVGDKPCIIYNKSHLNVWKASNILSLKFLQIIDGMNVLHAA